MYKFFLFLCMLAAACASASASGINLQGMCDIYTEEGAVNPLFFMRHPVHVMGVTPPGKIGVMNATTYVNPDPENGVFVPVYNSYSWQYNDIVCFGLDECYFRYLKSIPRVLGAHHVVSRWRSRVHLDQYLSKAQLGELNQLVESHYTVSAEQPIIFEHLAVGNMVIESRDYGINVEVTSFALNTPQGKVTALSELLATNLYTGQAEYSLTDYLSDPNGHLTFNTIYRPLVDCEDPSAPEGTAFACASIQAFLDGSDDLYLAEDPLGAGAGYPGLQVLTYTGPGGAPQAKRSVAHEVRWNDSPEARVTYAALVHGLIPEADEFTLRYVPGMHVTRAQHAQNIGM